MFKSDFLVTLRKKLGGNLPKLSPVGIALPKISPPVSDQRRFTHVKQSTGSTYNYGDFTSDNAFFWSSIDLSSYVGDYIEVYDATGKVATGYLAGIGAGETLGSELITGWTQNGPFETFITSGKELSSVILLHVDTAVAQVNSSGFVSNELYKLIVNLTLNSGQLPIAYAYTVSLGSLANGLNNFYSGITTGQYFQLLSSNLTNYSSINSAKRVTDPPSTAVHIVSSLNGTTRAWASIESGFDPNTIASWGIYHV